MNFLKQIICKKNKEEEFVFIVDNVGEVKIIAKEVMHALQKLCVQLFKKGAVLNKTFNVRYKKDRFLLYSEKIDESTELYIFDKKNVTKKHVKNWDEI